MKIGIVVFSYTGNTASAAEEIKKSLVKKGHTVRIEKIETDGDAQKMRNDIKFRTIPKTGQYDALIFGSPVWAFHLNPIMNRYLSDIPSLEGKKSAVYVTKDLKPHWTGGNQSVRKMKKLVEKKGGKVLGTGIIVWKKTGPDDEMPEVVKRISNLF
jgi:flavodoxin